VRQENLGCLLLYRDDLRRIVDEVQSLPGVRIELEADNIRLDDVETDLPDLGDRLSYFTLKAYRKTEAEVLSLRLAESRCTLATTDPGPEVSGVIGAIEDIARQRRRVPIWFPRISRHPRDAVARWWNTVFAILVAYLFIALFVRVSLEPKSAAPVPEHPILSTPLTVGTTIPVALILLFIIISSDRSRTILLTSRRDAGTLSPDRHETPRSVLDDGRQLPGQRESGETTRAGTSWALGQAT